MYIFILILLILANFYQLRQNKKITIKSLMLTAYKLILIVTFLVIEIIARTLIKDSLAISYSIFIFLIFYNSLTGGFTKDGILVFDGTVLLGRREILFKDIHKVAIKNGDDKLELSVYAYTTMYKQYFSKAKQEEILNILKKNHIYLEKRK